MSDTICMAVVSCAGTTRGFTDKATFKEYIKVYKHGVEDQVLLVLRGGKGTTASLSTALRMDWMMLTR